MKLLLGTSNLSKIAFLRKALENFDVEILTLSQMDGIADVEESGLTPLDNADIKANAYYQAYGINVCAFDSGLRFDSLPESLQPNAHVRRLGEKTMSDEEMINYYASIAKRFNRVTARYVNAVCMVLYGQKHSLTGDSISGEKFILTDRIHPKRVAGFPLDSISLRADTLTYYLDEPQRELADTMTDGIREFFKSCGLKEKIN